MPEKWTIKTVRGTSFGETPCWEFVFALPGGEQHGYLMPADIFEWRAAEYGIPVDDLDTLMRIVLHEPHMPVADHGDAAKARYADAGPTLYEATSTHEARAAHLARLDQAPVAIDVTDCEALDMIREAHAPDPDEMRARREIVDVMRWQNLYGALPIPAPVRPSGVPLYRKDR